MYEFYNDRDLHQIVRSARKLQAETTANGFRDLFRSLSGLFRRRGSQHAA